MKTSVRLNRRNRRARAGFSLVQALAVALTLGVLLAAAASQFNHTADAVAEHNLENQVRSLNSAIRVYRTFGGSLDSADSSHDVLARLQSRADSMSATRTAGLTGSLIDRRLVVKYQSDADAASHKPRALWDSSLQKFVIARNGEGGVAKFVLAGLDNYDSIEIGGGIAFIPGQGSNWHEDSSDGSGITGANSTKEVEAFFGTVREEVRHQNLQLAANSTWIWDYNDEGAGSGAAPTAVYLSGAGEGGLAGAGSGTGGGGGAGGGGAGGGGAGGGGPAPADTLDPPVFSIAGGNYLITDYDLPLLLTNPNPEGSSRIIYRIGTGTGWTPYLGEGIQVIPGMSVTAMVESILPEEWANSASRMQIYEAESLYLDPPAITTSAFGFDWGVNRTVLVTINHPNDASYSIVEYRVGEEEWQPYQAPFNLAASDYVYPIAATIEARVLATPEIYPEFYFDSAAVSAQIDPAPVGLVAPSISARGKQNNGHGNNIDGVDSSNQGQGHGGPKGQEDPSGDFDDERWDGKGNTDGYYWGDYGNMATILIDDPNEAGASEIEYRVNGAIWLGYTGAIHLEADDYLEGVVIEARAMATEGRYFDSGTVSLTLEAPLYSEPGSNGNGKGNGKGKGN